MSIIKELDEWLNDSGSREKEIKINETTIALKKIKYPSNIDAAIIIKEKEVLQFNYYIRPEEVTGINILTWLFKGCCENYKYDTFSMLRLSRISTAIDDIKNCIGGDE